MGAWVRPARPFRALQRFVPAPAPRKKHPVTRVFNFSPGPATPAPEPALRQAAEEMLDWVRQRHVGDGDEPPRVRSSSPSMPRPALRARADRHPCQPQGAFMQGGAIGENAIVPMNPLRRQRPRRLRRHRRVVKKSHQGGRKYGTVNVSRLARGESKLHRHSRRKRDWKLDAGAAYVHICTQRDDRRRGIPLDARHRRRAAGGRHVVATSSSRAGRRRRSTA